MCLNILSWFEPLWWAESQPPEFLDLGICDLTWHQGFADVVKSALLGWRGKAGPSADGSRGWSDGAISQRMQAAFRRWKR